MTKVTDPSLNTVAPNLFIVGAGKSGTYALYEYLKCHSEVYMAPRKEPNYFGLDLRYTKPRIGLQSYLDLFSEGVGYTFRGEASVNYLLSKTAAQEIWEFNNTSKIVIMLRDPVAVMQARHSQNVYAGLEPIGDFEDALRAEADRRQGRRMPRRVPVEDWLFYREWVRYTDQTKRYMERFGPGNVFVGLYDDFARNPRALFVELLQFLKLSVVDLPSFDHVNRNKRVRSRFLQRLTRGNVRVPPRFLKLTVPSKRMRLSLRRRITDWNAVEQQRTPLSPALESALRTELLPEIQSLSELLNRDLSHWGPNPSRDELAVSHRAGTNDQ